MTSFVPLSRSLLLLPIFTVQETATLMASFLPFIHAEAVKSITL
eukprot:XP_001706860.1 Hypothetical protein GL50803_28137 [Giardia lamblia ATCC 50803]